MNSATSRIGALLRVALPVAVASVLVAFALVNIVLVKTWQGEPEDGVLWRLEGTNVVAEEVAPGHAGALAGLAMRDVLLLVDGHEVTRPADVVARLHDAQPGRPVQYVVQRSSAELPVTVVLQPMPGVKHGLYFSLALVGILTIVVGTSVRLRRPNDLATLHFFWVTVAFFGTLAFSASGRYDRLDYFFEWADMVARLSLPPLFLHFALVFPERPGAWVRTRAGRALLPLIYLPAFAMGLGRVAVVVGLFPGTSISLQLQRVEWGSYFYLAACLAAGLVAMMRALRALRSVTAQRQLRWIVWGAAVGAVPFVTLYVAPLLAGGPAAPFAEYTAVLLGCVPLSFASALVRYRLMDIEVIIKKVLVVAAVVILLTSIYAGTLQLASLVIGADSDRSFWALFATLIVALLAPALWTSIQNALDRLYYRDRYDYRRALVSFARELNSDLDLDRLSNTLVSRVRETLVVDRIALFLAAHGEGRVERLVPVAAGGLEVSALAPIEPASLLASRLRAGQSLVLEDPVPARRLPADEVARWRDVGLYDFVPCVSNDTTIAVIALGHRPNGEPLNSEDMALLAAVGAQAATALENARLYNQLSAKAAEIEQLRQFSDSVVESLTDGLVVVDLEDRVLRWNRRMEKMLETPRAQAVGCELEDLFDTSFLETLAAARRESPQGTAVYRVSLEAGASDPRRQLLVNAAVAPFRTEDRQQAGWILVFEDVTERANLEEQLRLSEKMAAIGLLAAGVAHEVNTPLTGISSFTQMLLERADPADPSTELLGKIEQQTFRAAKIVNSLLNLSRPSGGEMKVIDLNAVITDVLSLLEHQFRTHRIQLRKHLERPSVLVLGTEYKLQQVFLNLFLNARDAMPRGGWLSVTTAVSGAEALVEVSDTGAGIPTEHLSRIYDPFFTTKSDGRGTGLGLSVSYGIVQEHGGTLTCESELNTGTRFRLVLPAADRGLRSSEAGTAAATRP